MKKIILTAMALAVVAMFSACTKDGVYKPAKKISRIYESSGSAKVLSQLWHWDGKKISSIDNYSSSGSISATYNFTYDGNKMSRVDCYANNMYVEFIYEGSKLKKFNSYYRGMLEVSGDVTHKGSKVSQITITYNDKKSGAKSPELMQFEDNIFELIIPCFNKEQHHKASAAKSVETATYTFTWDGKNISQTVLIAGSETVTRKYTYDKKKNPYYGDLFAFFDEDIIEWGSKNNVLTEIVTEQYNGETETRSYNYSYTYDGNWPTIQNISYTSGDYSSSYTRYFEYE